MARYEYRCATCESRFDVERPMTAAAGTVTCPAGHEARRVFSPVASVASTGSGPAPKPAPAMASGGCCGGACGCG